ncbi:MAG: acetylesterase, partial [Planctomycetota bacterium]
EALLDDGRGWSNADRDGFYNELSTEELLRRLGSWAPTVRERAAMALGRRQQDVSGDVVALLNSPDIHQRYGAAQALKHQRGRGGPAVPALTEAFRADDLWLRILAGEALADIGEPAKPAIPALLERFNVRDPLGDPRGMEQRYLAQALFAKRGGLLGRSLEGVDREALLNAVRIGLQNEDGRARGAFSSVYQNLTFEELKPLLPAILEAIQTPAPSGIMFADQIQTEGLRLLAEHHVEEGIELLADYARTMKQHGSQKRIVTVMNLLKRYGAHARRVTDELEATAVYFETEERNFPKKLSREKARIVREAINEIEASTQEPVLVSLGK